MSIEIEANVDLGVDADIQGNLNADTNVEVEVEAPEVEIEVQPEVEVQADANVELEVEAPAKPKFDMKAKTKELGDKTAAKYNEAKESMKKNIVMDVEIGGELNDRSEANCGFCCKETWKAFGICFGLSLAWILISVVFILS